MLRDHRLTRHLLPLAMVLMTSWWLWQRFVVADIPSRIELAEQRLKQLDIRLQERLHTLSATSSFEDFHEHFLHDAPDTSGISLFLFEGPTMLRWSDNQPDLYDVLPDTLKDASLLRLPNGCFWMRVLHHGNRTAVGLILLRHDYSYENRYLANEYNPSLDLPAAIRSGDQVPFHGPNGAVIDRLDLSGFQSETASDFVLIGWWIAFLLMLSGAYFRFADSSALHRWITILAALLLRLFMIRYHQPSAIYSTELFGPSIYASNEWFGSLGDLLINGCFLLFTSLFLVRLIPAVFLRHRRVAVSMALLFLVAGAWSFRELILGMVADSRIAFNVEDLSSIDRYTILALLSLCFYWLSYWLLLQPFLARIITIQRFRLSTLLLIISAVFTAFCLDHATYLRELEQRQQVAQRASMQRDPVAEYLLGVEWKNIREDQELSRAIVSGKITQEELNVLVANRHLRNYLGRYETIISLFDTSSQDVAAMKELDITNGQQLGNGPVYLLSSEAGRLMYQVSVPFCNESGDTIRNLELTLRSRIFSSRQGFPELFVSGSVRERELPENYSYARYVAGALVFEYGSYAYGFSDKEFRDTTTGKIYNITLNGYDHLVVQTSDDSIIVVSKPLSTWVSWITLFSWIFTYYTIFFSVVLLLIRFLNRKKSSTSLSRRIQLSVYVLVALSFFGIGAGTVSYIYKKYENDQLRTIGEQLNGLWVLLGENVGTGNAFSSAQDGNLKSEFRRIASNTNIDFNVYDENGQLYYSSQPRIFEQGIVSDRINPEALHELIAFRRTQFIHPERIGTLNYIAAYAPFVSEKGTMTGFLQLPYFEKQKERNREVSGFLSALLNIYVLLFALAVFIAALISSRITQPLTVIQERMSAMRFGRTNEPIAYSADDEIGQLVNEYNRMLQELAESADKLARSERESAWREMAKQVAHEIKNPLTPMKLSVQHLQRAWTDHRDDREQMTLKMAQTLIQQIDTLSAIATEFSNFAKMPQAAPQALTISDVLRQTITLFSGSSSHEFRLNMPDQPLKVYADKDHLNRVFSNLIKNAVQAIPDDRQGVISVSLQEVEGFAEMNVQDNGSGIPQEQFDRIFMPNFTTKNSGTGLGLAMVKNIVEQGGGSVRFVSEVGIGSTFTVRWPLAGGLFS